MMLAAVFIQLQKIAGLVNQSTGAMWCSLGLNAVWAVVFLALVGWFIDGGALGLTMAMLASYAGFFVLNMLYVSHVFRASARLREGAAQSGLPCLKESLLATHAGNVICRVPKARRLASHPNAIAIPSGHPPEDAGSRLPIVVSRRRPTAVAGHRKEVPAQRLFSRRGDDLEEDLPFVAREPTIQEPAGDVQERLLDPVRERP